MKYRIKWFAPETGATGHGEPIFNTKKMAFYTARRLNKEWPILVHTVEEVTVEEVEKTEETKHA